jgi:hypothetical protein
VREAQMEDRDTLSKLKEIVEEIKNNQ